MVGVVHRLPSARTSFTVQCQCQSVNSAQGSIAMENYTCSISIICFDLCQQPHFPALPSDWKILIEICIKVYFYLKVHNRGADSSLKLCVQALHT